jgi:murein DD-endopeptidase MepM/ murein hydrolase activator NlpD
MTFAALLLALVVDTAPPTGAPPPDGVPAAALDTAPPPLLLDVLWEEDGLPTGRIAKVEVRAPRAMRAIEGTLGTRRVIALPASPDRKSWFVLAPVDIEAEPRPIGLQLQVTLDDESRVFWGKPVPVVEAPYDERAITVAKKFTSPSKKQRLRAAKEAKELDRVLDAVSPERLWRGSWAKPTAGEETSPFGTKRTYNKKKHNRHFGWDLDGKVGDAITAANRGRVVLAKDRFYSGGTVVIDHGEGLFTMYFHMSRIDVKPGQIVEKGQGLGAVGASGQVTGPHLHFTVKLGGLSQDPKYLVAMDLSADALDAPAPGGAPVTTSTTGEAKKAVP